MAAGGATELFPLVSRIRGGDGRRQTVHVITCACGREDVVAAHNTRLSEGHLRGTFQKRGWLVSETGRHACPTCLAANMAAFADRRRAAAALRALANPPEKVMKPASPPSPAASSAIVSLYVLLEDGYDRAAKAYKPGWSDERIAKETGLSLEAVKARREADFGPLVVDTLLDGLQTDWQALCSNLDAIAKHLAAAAAAHKVVSGRVAALESRLEKLGEKLGAGPDMLRAPSHPAPKA